MSQKGLFAAFDAAALDCMVVGGQADIGLYGAPGACVGQVPQACRVIVDRDVQTVGDTLQRSAGNVEVTYLLADVSPAKDGVLVVDGDTYVNQRQIRNDGSLSRWAVRRG